MRTSAIIVAAGSGIRLGRPEPKAFVHVGGRSLLRWSLRTIADVAEIAEVVIAVPEGREAAARAEITAAGLEVPVKIAAGGAERQDSVRIALALTSAESELVAIHDAARPLAPAALWIACLRAAERVGGAIAAMPLADTLKRVEDRAITATLPRAGLWQAQTPQAFRRELLCEAHKRALETHVVATDDADLVERIGGQVEVVQSSALNLKITTPEDLELAEALASAEAG